MKKVLKQLKNLTLIYGIGFSLATKIINTIGSNKNLALSNLKKFQTKKFQTLVKTIPTAKLLKNNIKESIEFLQKIRAFKGLKYKSNYISRDQRPSVNVKTK